MSVYRAGIGAGPNAQFWHWAFSGPGAPPASLEFGHFLDSAAPIAGHFWAWRPQIQGNRALFGPRLGIFGPRSGTFWAWLPPVPGIRTLSVLGGPKFLWFGTFWAPRPQRNFGTFNRALFGHGHPPNPWNLDTFWARRPQIPVIWHIGGPLSGPDGPEFL